MLERILGFAIAIVLVFTILKFVEMRYIEREFRSLKLFIRDAVYVLVSSLAVLYLYFRFEKNIHEFYCFMTNSKVLVPNATQVFTDEPTF